MTLRQIRRAAPHSLALCLPATLALLLAAPVHAESNVETEEQKMLYFIGTQIGTQLRRSMNALYLSDEERKMVLQGLGETIRGSAMELDPEIYGAKLRIFQEVRMKRAAEIETVESLVYLEAQSQEKGAESRPSGLIITEIKAGDGASPKPTDKVKVAYIGRLRDGSIFDRSPPGRSREFPLNGVIPCWTEGVGLMKVGGKAKLVCPAEIAYKDRGQPPSIPPAAAITFEVELLEIVE